MDELDENWVDEIFGLQGAYLLFVFLIQQWAGHIK